MTPGPLFLIALPLALAPVVFVLRRLTLPAAFLASATAFVMAGLCLRPPLHQPVSVFGWGVALSQPVTVLGREFSLELADCYTVGFICLIAAVAFLFAWRVPQGHQFFPLGLVILSLLGAAVMVRLFLFAVLFLWIAGIVAVFIIQGPGRGAVQYLVIVSLATLPLLIAPWLIDFYAVNPDNLALLRYAAVLLAIGFAALLAVVPFHGWVSAVAADAPPVVAAFVFSVTNAVVLLRLLNLLKSYSWLAENPQVFSLLRLGGLLMAIVGGLLAFAQRDFGRLLGYALLSDMGCTLVALGFASSAALTAALLQVAHRSVGLMLTAMGLAVVRRQAGSDSFLNLAGVAKRLPLATAGLVLGNLSLAGMPITAGFPSRWAIYRILPTLDLALAMLLSGAGVALGCLHGLSTLLGHSNERSAEREPLIASLMILGMIVLCIGLGLHPQWLLPAIQRVVESFSLVAR
jgi:formate hydrogenlyase subunit 3/multisubunit Na+/H+ antiporter MnhD subunit